ncbi:MAG TPA: ABC transporter permease [Bryobacteraceae bacterium]|nr:ABC transporter permease [Bryobacteraceae bacterium]
MSTWSRLVNVFRGDRLNRDLDEELEAHVADAIRDGRDPGEARRALGHPTRLREDSRDIKLIPWLDSLRADIKVGWRQLNKKKTASAAAVLSLGLAIGACTSAFRLIDALLLRPLPVAHPERLYVLARKVDADTNESFRYPLFVRMRDAVKDEADVIAISQADRKDLSYGPSEDTEKAAIQYVSGTMFGSFGLLPAAGRLFTASDDEKPGGHPYAVLSHDYWSRRFHQDPRVIGRTFRMSNDPMWMTSEQPNVFEVIGVAAKGFTGTEPGTVTDIFLPTAMHAGVRHADWTWIRVWLSVRPGASFQAAIEKLRVVYQANVQERLREIQGEPKKWSDRILRERLEFEPSSAGISEVQRNYRVPLTALAILVALVLLIACANVANLMAAQSSARAREMALRLSIGAGRWRLLQLMMVESTWLGMLAAGVGALFAAWSAPFVVQMINPPGNPIRLVLPADWRVLGFGAAIAVGATILFGLAPALRASAVKPMTALKGGEKPHSRRRLLRALIAVQVTFCFLVLFVAALFAATFQHLSHQAMGFSSDRLLTLEIAAEKPQPAAAWDQLLQHMRSATGVESAALSSWPLLSGIGWNDAISVDGGSADESEANFLSVSPGWMETMTIPFVDGRDFRAGDNFPVVAIVNEAFARRFFHGANPVGKTFVKAHEKAQFDVVGVVRDARYGGIRGPIPPVAYVPMKARDGATLIVRTVSENPLALASALSKEVARAHPAFRVSLIRTQEELVRQHTIRERMLSTLALFFAIVAVLLAGVGLYGVLDYSVVERRREIGIRIAIGARAGDIVRRVVFEAFSMVALGALLGLALGEGSSRYLRTLLYGVKSTDAGMIALPFLAIVAAALLAALPSVLRAVSIDPVATLRND